MSLLFGALYFIQGITEPTDGLLAQPINSLLKSWQQDAGQITAFTALFWIPWAIKPLYGLISDLVPLAHYHRKSYLMAASGLTAVSLGLLYLCDLRTEAIETMLLLLMPATVGVAFSDVVVDALMVEKGQPHGLTGRFQAVQWGAMYGATILTGWFGGYLSQHGDEQLGFLLCALLMAATVVLCWRLVWEQKAGTGGRDVRGTLALLRHAAESRTLVAVGAFMFCWNFNPFSLTVLYLHMTGPLHIGAPSSEQFYGTMMSCYALAAMVGSFAYGFYCRRVSMRVLIHVSIVLGIASSLGYWLLAGQASAIAIAMAAGFATATATVIQFDLAAQVCPPQAAGTLFALLLGLANLGTALSMALGGRWYEDWSESWGNPWAFNALVGIGALFTAGCWLVVPFLELPRALPNDKPITTEN